MASVRFEHVNKTFDKGVVAVSGFDLDIESGEFVVIVGPSGCGKSTVLRMIAGLEDPSAGAVYIGGENMDGVPPGGRDVAMVFQDYTLYPNLTVRDNLAFGLKIRKFDKSEIDRRVTAAAASLGVTALLDRLPRDLSGGEKQRIALGRVLVRRPKVFLLDEPLSGVDAKFRAQMRAEIVRLHKETGITFVYVTHDQTEAMTMGDKIVVMDGGRIVQVDTPAVLYDYPATAFSAAFIGMPQMNIIPAVASGGKITAGGITVAAADVRDITEPLTDGQEVYIGIRPEDVKIGDTGVECSLVSLEQLGDETVLYLDAGFSHNIIAKTAADFGLSAGRRMSFGFDPQKVKLFDRSGGRSLSGMPVYNKFPVNACGGGIEILGCRIAADVLSRTAGEPAAAGVTPDGFVRGGGFPAEALSVREYPGVAVCRIAAEGVQFTAKLAPGGDLKRGAKVTLDIKGNRVVLFDGGGARISAAHIKGPYENVTFNPQKGADKRKGVIADIELTDNDIIVSIKCKDKLIAARACDVTANLYVGGKVRFAACKGCRRKEDECSEKSC